MSKYLQLNDINAYKIAFHLSNEVWRQVMQWDSLAKWTIGKQFTEAVDSIAANIAEGFGRYHKKDKIKFYRYAYGSVQESLNWNEMAKTRRIIDLNAYRSNYKQLRQLQKEIHALINFTNQRLTI